MNKTVRLYVALALGAPAVAWGSGFALIEQNASGLGNAYAGAAAGTEDASTIFFNPAGMTRLQGGNFVFAGHLISPSSQFRNTGSTPAVSTVGGAGPFAMNGSGGDGGDPTLIPSAYLSWQLTPQLFAGVGISAPFGLKTEYDSSWMGRFHAIKSELTTVNINPSIAFKVNDMLSVGAGISWQRIDAELTKAVNYSFIASSAGLGAFVGNNVEGRTKVEGSDEGWGYNLGIMFNPLPDTHVGLAYRSAINFKLSGNVSYDGRTPFLDGVLNGALGAGAAATAAGLIGNGGISADIKLPATTSLAVAHKLNSQWQVLADVTYTEWSSLQALNIVRDSGATLENTPFNYKDTWRAGVGANYQFNDSWKLRLGAAYDESPARLPYRTPRIPDNDRYWLALGAQYKISNAGAIDFGYAHLFVMDGSVDLSGPPAITAAQAAGRGNLTGNFENSVDIVSVQYRHSF